jgi:hypothetical protein
MHAMMTYLLFSLKRRWFSFGSLIIFGLGFFITLALVFMDIWFLQNQVVTINWPTHLSAHLETYDYFKFTDEDAMINVSFSPPSQYTIHPHTTNVSTATLTSLITYAHQRYILDQFDVETQNQIVVMLEPMIETSNSSSSVFPIMIISFLYFTLLGFSSNLSSDILSEKHSQALLMILSTLKRKDYFLMKVYQSWINIFIQSMLVSSAIILAILFRSNFDQGKGLLSFLYEQQWIPLRFESFSQIIQVFTESTHFSLSVVFAGISFVIGLMTCMLFLLWMSLKAQRSEELASIQTPYYILIVLMYYVSLWINELQGFSQSVSSWIIHVPVLSMIFHPLQLATIPVPIEISVLSILIALSLLIFIFKGSYNTFKAQSI